MMEESLKPLTPAATAAAIAISLKLAQDALAKVAAVEAILLQLTEDAKVLAEDYEWAST